MATFKNSLDKFYNKFSAKEIRERAEILADYQLVQNDFDSVLSKIKNIKWITIAEAPQSHGGYIYNPNNKKGSVFIYPSNLPKHLNVNNKSEMIDELINHGILIIDLYPLPLPSECYKKVSCYDRMELSDHWDLIIDKIKSKVTKDTRISFRYKKFQRNKYYKEFEKKYLTACSNNNSLPFCFAGTNMALDKVKFSELFK